jgi:hypothetical protein
VAGNREEHHVITIPTTELIGGISDVLPIILDPKSDLAGLVVEWDGESLHFTAYDVFAAATVAWTPGEGAERDDQIQTESSDSGYEPEWGGDDAPWRTWIWLDSAKEILKLFKLPAKLWRFPVTLKCSPTGDRLILERTDSPRGDRLLTVPADPDKARREIPDVRAIALGLKNTDASVCQSYFHSRLGAFGTARAHGTLTMFFGSENEPTAIMMGSRYRGFIYPTDAKHVRPFNLLRDGTGLVTS